MYCTENSTQLPRFMPLAYQNDLATIFFLLLLKISFQNPYSTHHYYTTTIHCCLLKLRGTCEDFFFGLTSKAFFVLRRFWWVFKSNACLTHVHPNIAGLCWELLFRSLLAFLSVAIRAAQGSHTYYNFAYPSWHCTHPVQNFSVVCA